MNEEEIVIIDQAYKYQVDEILAGCIGYVRLMFLKEFSRKLPNNAGNFEKLVSKYPYRDQLAAKTMKSIKNMSSFAEACNLWSGLNQPGIVPLLKTVEIGDELLALMPRYSGSLRMLMRRGAHNPAELLKALNQAVFILSKVHKEYGIVHQDLKPENFLFFYHGKELVFELSDWGIANVQAGIMQNDISERTTLQDEFRVTSYLAPERFDAYLSDICADVFGLGMMCFEILTGKLPFDMEKGIAEQIASGEYYDKAQAMLSRVAELKMQNLILRMIAPSLEKRMQDYGEFLTLIASL